MAQKIGLAILALLGLANCGIYAGPSGLHYYHQVQASHRSEGASSSGSHPQLGEKEVKLGYGILSFANSQEEKHSSEENSRRHEYNSGRLERKSGHRQAESDKYIRIEHNSNPHRNERNSLRGKSSGRRQSSPQERPAQKVQIKVVNPPVVVVRSEHKSVDSKRDSSIKKPKSVYVPVFGKLRQEENSNSGNRQASNIIVTAPLISTDKVDSHRVGYNERVGKSNCPQCKEDKIQAAQTKKSSEQAIQKNTDQLTTKIRGPIDHVEVDTVHTPPNHLHRKHSENESCDSESNSASHHSKQTRNVRYQGESINWKAVKSSLARGQARSNAPFVVGSVVIHKQENSSDHH